MKRTHMSIDPVICFVIIFCIGYAMLHIPFLRMVPTNNSNTYYDATFAILQNKFNPFILYDGYKPPVLFLLMAALFSILTPSIIIGGSITAIAASISLWFTYKLGTVLFDKKTGIAAMLLLSVFPFFISHSLQFTDAMFVTPLLLACVYYFYTNNKKGYIISATLAVLTREQCVFVPLSLMAVTLITTLWTTKKITAKQCIHSLYLTVPLIAFALWMLLNKKIFGWYLWPDNVHYFSFNPMMLATRIVHNLKIILFDCGALPFVACSAILFVGIVTKKIKMTKLQHHATAVFVSLFFVNFIFLTAGVSFHPRYMFSVYPFLAILTAGTFFLLSKPNAARLMTLGLGILFLLYQGILLLLPIRYWGETDASIVRMASLYTKSFSTIHSQYPNALIVTTPRIYPWNDTTFGRSPNSILYHTFLWNDEIPKEKELLNACGYAKTHALSPIVYIHESENMDPIYDLQNKVLLQKISVDSFSSLSHHLLFLIDCPIIDTTP